MRLEFAFLADASTTADGKVYVLGGGLTRVVPQKLPWPQSLAICARFAGEEAELAGEHDLTIELEDAGGDMIFGPSTIKLTTHPPPLKLQEGEVPTLWLSLTINGVAFRSYGPHQVRLSVGDQRVTLSLAVVDPGAG